MPFNSRSRLRFPSLTWRAFAAAGVLLASHGCSGKPGEAPPAPAATAPRPLTLRDVSASVGVSYTLGHQGRSPLTILETIGHGCAWLDFDGDDRLDLLLLGPDQVRLYRNLGERFQDVTAGQGLALPGYWIAAAVGDYDNDGWPDLFLSGHRCRALLRNRQGQGFSDVTRAAGIGVEQGWGTSAAFADLDHDGRLDLCQAHYVQFGPASRQHCNESGLQVTCAPSMYPAERLTLFRNEGDGKFRDATTAFGFDKTAGRGLGVLPLDYDADGRTDLYVANDTEPADLFRGSRSLPFENVAHATGTALADDGKALGGMGVDAQDYDRDGWTDLLLMTFEAEPKCLWRGGPEGRFTDQGLAAGLDTLRPLVSWGAGLLDLDNDGWLDLLCANGHVAVGRVDPNHHYAQPLRLFRGNGAEFQDVTAQLDAALQAPFVGRGVAFGDYDNDGRLDVAVSNLEGRALVLRNESEATGSWLGVRLSGASSNRQGLGARVTLEAGGAKWTAEARTARAIYSASDARLHFGLGEAKGPAAVTVYWPSGKTTRQEVADLNRYVTIREKSEAVRSSR